MEPDTNSALANIGTSSMKTKKLHFRSCIKHLPKAGGLQGELPGVDFGIGLSSESLVS
jgi:hypothetical protein